MTLNGHDDVIKSLTCWDQYLLSCSLDCCTLKGVLALHGMTDSDGKPIVYCSCGDNSIHIYELPGRLFAKLDVDTLQIDPGGLIFTGDRTGLLAMWKWLAEPQVAP
uniref:Uncharacterized protein n=2 Tax=Fagus sylvatica TaxID=28930 RepID=A0A2N9I0R3_FAGSY